MTPAAELNPLVEKLPLAPFEIAIGGRKWSLGIVRDEEVQLNFSADRAQFPFGLMIWESAIVLAEVLAERPLSGKSVLELGCGIGLPGLVAAAQGARVVQTDHDSLALAVAAENAKRNGIAGIRREVADWHHWQSRERFDIVAGADMIYDTGDYATLVELFEKTISPGGKVVLTDPNRLQTIAFLTQMEDAGWQYRITQHRTVDVTHGAAGSGVEVQLVELWR